MPPPRIEIYDEFFEPQLHKELLLFIRNSPWRPGWHSTKKYEFTQFHAEFGYGDSNNRDDVYERIKSDEVKRAWDAVQVKAIRAAHKLLRCYANLAVYGVEGYSHEDTPKQNESDLTCIAYFCGDYWKADYCGETALLIGDEIIKSVMPKPNRLLLFPSNMRHIARSVTRICPLPRVALVFKSTPV